LWKVVPEDEKELFKERAEILKQESKREWDKQSDVRDEVGHRHSLLPVLIHHRGEEIGAKNSNCQCQVPGQRLMLSIGRTRILTSLSHSLSLSCRATWEKKFGVNQQSKSEKKVISKKKSKPTDESGSSSDEDDAGQSSKRKLPSSSSSQTDGKKRRVAIEHALVKMKESGSHFPPPLPFLSLTQRQRQLNSQKNFLIRVKKTMVRTHAGRRRRAPKLIKQVQGLERDCSQLVHSKQRDEAKGAGAGEQEKERN
jgi:hypothetical protein